jgi:excisionase family DNA binding protein
MNHAHPEVGGFDPSSTNFSQAGRRRLLTVKEAAEAMCISRSSVYRLFDAGQLAWVQIGSSRRVTSAEIERFIAAHTERAAS